MGVWAYSPTLPILSSEPGAVLDRVVACRALDVRVSHPCSLTDNFEWLEGYRMRFGLIAIRYDRDLAREPRPSARVYADAVARRSPHR